MHENLMVVPPPNNRTWPEVYIYEALVAAGVKEFMPLPTESSSQYSIDAFGELVRDFTSAVEYDVMDVYSSAPRDHPETLLYAEAYTMLPTYYKSVVPFLTSATQRHVALVHGGSFIPGDVLAWADDTELQMLQQYDLVIAPSEYHWRLQIQRYSGFTRPEVVVARWPLNPDVHEVQEAGLKPRNERLPRIVFPHRQIPEKGWPLFEEADALHTGCVYVATGKSYDRDVYLSILLGDSRAVFASAEMETYGVAVEEAMALGCCPVLNNHEVYRELYADCQVHWHDGTPEDVVRKVKGTMDCDIVHYDVDRDVSAARALRILDLAAGS